MLHVFVDTNIYLSLFAFTDDKIDELNKLVELIEAKSLKLYVTSVVNQEFNRNRDRKILEAMMPVQKFSASLSLPRFMDHHPEAREIQNLLKEVSKLQKELIKKANSEIASLELAADKLFQRIRKISFSKAIDEKILSAARTRLDRGNPPGKDGSLGDRQNWEFLLDVIPEGQDLHIVSRDKDFGSPWGDEVPNSYLKLEWESRKKSNLYLYSNLRSFARRHFPEIDLASDVRRKISIRNLVAAQTQSEVINSINLLQQFVEDFSPDDAIKIFNCLVKNEVVRNLSDNEIVQDFYAEMLINHWQHLDAVDYHEVTRIVPDPIPF